LLKEITVMAGSVSWTCPKCGVTEGGYRTQGGASRDSAYHQWKKHHVDVTSNGKYERAAQAVERERRRAAEARMRRRRGY
jgi:hypothetical protein